jgi:hypothetical protein
MSQLLKFQFQQPNKIAHKKNSLPHKTAINFITYVRCYYRRTKGGYAESTIKVSCRPSSYSVK